jgi:hypothetical protein
MAANSYSAAEFHSRAAFLFLNPGSEAPYCAATWGTSCAEAKHLQYSTKPSNFESTVCFYKRRNVYININPGYYNFQLKYFLLGFVSTESILIFPLVPFIVNSV